jgi:hypothetical protein
MAVQNLNLVLNTLCAVNAVEQGNAVAGILGLRMPRTMSHGRPMSPRSATFDSTTAKAKRVGRSAAGLPGYPVRPGYWRESVTGATQVGTGRNASFTCVSGRGLSERCACHHHTSGHDYPSHDRRDDRQRNRTGSALSINSGK